MTARDALRAMRERAEAAGKGPWMKDPDDPAIVLRPDRPGGWDGTVIARVQRDDFGLVEEGTTEFIAHARTDVPALVEALEAVLAAHSPGNVRLETLGFDFDADEYRTRIVTSCAGCHHEHPCPTVTAIETALDGAS